VNPGHRARHALLHMAPSALTTGPHGQIMADVCFISNYANGFVTDYFPCSFSECIKHSGYTNVVVTCLTAV